jgi:hypothetical protein
MLAIREALAAYRDGWVRVCHAPRILVLLAGATILVTAAGMDGEPASRPFVLDVFEPLGTALMGGAIAAALDASDVTRRLGGESAPWLLWLLVVIGGVVLTGGVMDRYARQRPLDARTFWGVSGELSFRLIRLSAIGGVLFSVLTGALVLVLDAIATAVLGAAGAERGEALLWVLELGLRVPYLAAAFALFAATDCGRVRMVVERRRSALFAFMAGARFAWRHRAAVVVLYAALFATAFIPWALVSAAELSLEPGVLARLLDAIQVGAAITAALVSAAAATALFQAGLAHASYVAPPHLVWPDSPAIESLRERPGAEGRRDFPPAV